MDCIDDLKNIKHSIEDILNQISSTLKRHIKSNITNTLELNVATTGNVVQNFLNGYFPGKHEETIMTVFKNTVPKRNP